jgi:hypothetical protein
VDLLQIHVPTPFGDVMGVADAVPELGTFATDFTHFRHLELLLFLLNSLPHSIDVAR